MKKKNKIEIKNLHKAFGSNKVLTGVNLTIKEKQSLVVLGGSGSGKSVLIKNIVNLMIPDRGSIKVDGKEITKMKGRERDKLMDKFGFLFQGGALFDSLNVWQNVAFRLLNTAKIDKADAKDIAIDKLSIVGLTPDVAELYPAELSGGMQKRVALARAIAADPEIIFFDEPTTGLDPIMSDIINDLIIKCKKSVGATTLSITHDIASARKIADRIALLYEGQIIWEGSVKELDTTKNPYVRQFINGRSEGPMQLSGHKPQNNRHNHN
jgi:phospholipid/cholesterol/gamma-HCH transport system ATP-binding protein